MRSINIFFVLACLNLSSFLISGDYIDEPKITYCETLGCWQRSLDGFCPIHGPDTLSKIVKNLNHYKSLEDKNGSFYLKNRYVISDARSKYLQSLNLKDSWTSPDNMTIISFNINGHKDIEEALNVDAKSGDVSQIFNQLVSGKDQLIKYSRTVISPNEIGVNFIFCEGNGAVYGNHFRIIDGAIIDNGTWWRIE